MKIPLDSKAKADDSLEPSMARTDTQSTRQIPSGSEDPLPGSTSSKPRRLYAGPVVVAIDTHPEKRMGPGQADDRDPQLPNRLQEHRPDPEEAKGHSAAIRAQAQAWADKAITNPSARARFADHVTLIVHRITAGRSDPRPGAEGPRPTHDRAGVLAESPKSLTKPIER